MNKQNLHTYSWHIYILEVKESALDKKKEIKYIMNIIKIKSNTNSTLCNIYS